MGASPQGTCVAHVSYVGNAKPTVHFAEQKKENLKDHAACKALATKLDFARHHCSLLLKNGDYQLLQVEKPNVPAEEQKQALRWKLKDMLDYPAEQATIEVMDVPADPSNDRRQAYVHAAVARNDVLSEHIQQLQASAPNSLEAIDIPELAQRNIAARLEQAHRGLAMLSINGTEGLLTLTSGGELYKARNIDIYPKQMQSEDSAVKSGAYERISLDIQRSLDNFERQVPYISINRLVLAPFEGREDFYDYLKTALYLQVDRFDLSDVFDIAANVDVGDLAMQASLLPVLGAALREEQSA